MKTLSGDSALRPWTFLSQAGANLNGAAAMRPALLATLSLVVGEASIWAGGTATVTIRGKSQTLHLYGPEDGEPVVVSSGDGGWIHLAPQVAELLSGRGYLIVGFDCKAYLSSFTDGKTTLSEEDVPGDYRVLIDYASRRGKAKPILVGVSEGAGLSVLAATGEENKKAILGVIGLGLPDVTELGWRWRDFIIYITHKTPNEPSFRVSRIIQKVSPVPLAALHSTQDEFAPLTQVQKLMEQASEPKRLWIIEASNHRFSGNEEEFAKRLMEAIGWAKAHQPESR